MTRTSVTTDDVAAFFAHIATPEGMAAFRAYVDTGVILDEYFMEHRKRHRAGDDSPITPPPVRHVRYERHSDNSSPVTRVVGDPIAEHGQLYPSGAVLVRFDHPTIERAYPLTEWIEASQRDGGKILRRTIIVVENWREVPRP